MELKKQQDSDETQQLFLKKKNPTNNISSCQVRPATLPPFTWVFLITNLSLCNTKVEVNNSTNPPQPDTKVGVQPFLPFPSWLSERRTLAVHGFRGEEPKIYTQKKNIALRISWDPQRPGYFEDLNTPASYRFRAPSIGNFQDP